MVSRCNIGPQDYRRRNALIVNNNAGTRQRQQCLLAESTKVTRSRLNLRVYQN